MVRPLALKVTDVVFVLVLIVALAVNGGEMRKFAPPLMFSATIQPLVARVVAVRVVLLENLLNRLRGSLHEIFR